MKLKCHRDGEVITLAQELKAGGEGTIYSVLQSPDLAVKIYKPSKLSTVSERISKLEAMLSRVPHDPMQNKGHASIAWPKDLVQSSETGKIVGFVMPRIRNAQEISSVRPPNRSLVFPTFTYLSLCRVAQNLASAVRALHERGYVIGDVSESNILVTPETLVTLVDTDSFQVRDDMNGRVYRCPVFTELFTPPEIFGKKLDQIDRSPAQDMFGVAVVFFQLLMEGVWPFFGVLDGVEPTPDVGERLRRGYFPYGDNPAIRPSPVAPPFEMLHPSLQRLFRQCFGEGHSRPETRPDAHTWQRTLSHCEKDLIKCLRNKQHLYFNHCATCPWCERAQRFRQKSSLNWDPFPAFKSAGYSRPKPASTGVPRPSSPVRPSPAPMPQPQPAPVQPVFSASSASVSLGQPVTLQWAVPNAHDVRIANQAGKVVFAGSAPSGAVTVYPTKNQTYNLTASGLGVISPKPLSVSVIETPQPVALRATNVVLKEPLPLERITVDLRSPTSLRKISIRLLSPTGLKEYYLPLNSFGPLNPVSLELTEYQQLIDPSAACRNPSLGPSWRQFARRFW